MYNNEDFLRLVTAVLASDGHVSGKERRFLVSLAGQWQVSLEAVDALVVQALAGKEVFKLPVTLKGQKDLITALADAVAVDGEIAPG
ncbi:MAG: hypothetical protein RDV41_12230, partial [Planctomycetota bacterium]|nr:hypothetical protein [Planctomycetota bacterium]